MSGAGGATPPCVCLWAHFCLACRTRVDVDIRESVIYLLRVFPTRVAQEVRICEYSNIAKEIPLPTPPERGRPTAHWACGTYEKIKIVSLSPPNRTGHSSLDRVIMLARPQKPGLPADTVSSVCLRVISR